MICFTLLVEKANSASKYLKSRLKAIGVVFESTPTNQQFITLNTAVVEVLEKSYLFEIWTDFGDKKTIRLGYHISNNRTPRLTHLLMN